MFQALSQKYNVARIKENPVMLPAWVEDVWTVSSSEMVTAGDPRFAHHKCRAMQGVSVSVSQLNRNDKNLLRKSLETHGGSYSGVLDMEKTSVLVSLSSLSYFSVKSTITTVRSALVLLETSTATSRSGRFPA